MLSTFLYLILCSGRNRLRVQLRRLRQPRYAIASIVGALYFGLMIVRPRGRSGAPTILPASQEATEIGIALILFGVAALAWLWPSTRAELAFTRADVQWLFTAPLTRRQLLEYAILRSLAATTFTAALMAVFVGPAGVGAAARFFVGFWISGAAMSLHLSGVGLSRESLGRHGLTGLSRQWLPLLVVSAAAVTIGGSVVAAWPRIVDPLDGGSMMLALHAALSHGAPAVVLWPFNQLTRLTLAPSVSASAAALPGALLLLALNAAWVIRSDTAFEEASAERAEKVARASAGRKGGLSRTVTRRSPPFVLAPIGPPETALLWKNLILLGRYSRRTLVVLVVALVIVGVGAGSAVSESGETGRAGFIISTVLLFVVVAMGPMMMRNDLRQDLAHLAVLKTWPVRGVAIVRGELLAPAAVLSALACLIIATAAMLSPDSAARSLAADGTPRLSVAIAAMLAAPALILTQLVVYNGIAILFPGWIRIGQARTPGVEMMGQSMLMMVGVLLAVAGALIPAVLIAMLAGFALQAAAGAAPLVVMAAILSMVLIGECLLAVVGLGAALDRTDISAVDAPA